MMFSVIALFFRGDNAAVRLSQACVLPVLAPYVFVDVLHETVAFLAFQFSSYLDSCEVTFLVGFSCSSFNPNILISGERPCDMSAGEVCRLSVLLKMNLLLCSHVSRIFPF